MGKISLGSYDSTNEIAKELGKGLTKGNRQYHFDRYFPDGSHKVYGFFDGNPGYDVVKKLANEVLMGDRRSREEGSRWLAEGRDGG